MILDFCAVCRCTENLTHHHWKPRVMGGGDEEENMLTLCWMHHCEIHGNLQGYVEGISLVELSRLGKEKVKHQKVEENLGCKGSPENLVKINKDRKERAKKFSEKIVNLILKYKEDGKSHRQICKMLNNDGYCTRTGEKFFPVHITRIIKYGGA